MCACACANECVSKLIAILAVLSRARRALRREVTYISRPRIGRVAMLIYASPLALTLCPFHVPARP